MYKVVLIDDEEVIVEGLKTVMPWHEFSCEVAAVAYNGQSGAKAIYEHKPDIVFCDIRMPGQDGLTMLAGVLSEFPNLQVTILSGYRDFDYAKQAISLGVTRYLVKPSKVNELREALTAMTDKLRNLQESPGDAPHEVDSFVVRGALDYIHEHYAEKLTLQLIADHVYVSVWHLSKLFRKYTGESFSELCQRVRVEQAKNLLRDPALRIHEVSEMTGFADVTHFSKVFKKITGCSAGEYRNKRL